MLVTMDHMVRDRIPWSRGRQGRERGLKQGWWQEYISETDKRADRVREVHRGDVNTLLNRVGRGCMQMIRQDREHEDTVEWKQRHRGSRKGRGKRQRVEARRKAGGFFIKRTYGHWTETRGLLPTPIL